MGLFTINTGTIKCESLCTVTQLDISLTVPESILKADNFQDYNKEMGISTLNFLIRKAYILKSSPNTRNRDKGNRKD